MRVVNYESHASSPSRCHTVSDVIQIMKCLFAVDCCCYSVSRFSKEPVVLLPDKYHSGFWNCMFAQLSTVLPRLHAKWLLDTAWCLHRPFKDALYGSTIHYTKGSAICIDVNFAY